MEHYPEDAPQTDNVNELKSHICKLNSDLDSERKRSAALEQELKELKERTARAAAVAEIEEEGIANRLIKRVTDLQREKEKLVLEVEREEEMLTNTLQRKLDALRRDKIDLENQLEQEQEYITNKLQKQLQIVKDEKHALELRWEEHTKQLMEKLSEHEAQMRTERTQLQQQLESEEESLTNRLAKQMDLVRRQYQETRKEAENYKERNQQIRRALDRLKAENYALRMKINREEERQRSLMSEKVLITQCMEIDSERQFNMQSRALPHLPLDTRDRSFSEPPLMFPPGPGHAVSRHRAPSLSSHSSRGSIYDTPRTSSMEHSRMSGHSVPVTPTHIPIHHAMYSGASPRSPFSSPGLSVVHSTHSSPPSAYTPPAHLHRPTQS